MDEILQVRSAYREQQWMEIIRDCRASGLSNKAYCQEKGISEKTFYYWLRKLRTAAAEGFSPQIVELKTPARAEETVYIRYRGAELTLPGDTDVETIAAVLRALQQL